MHDGRKRLFAEGLHHKRAGVQDNLFLQFLISLLQGMRTSAPQDIVEKECQILPVIIAVLPVGRSCRISSSAAPQMLGEKISLHPGNHRFKTDLLQIFDRPLHDPLETYMIQEARSFADRQILAGHFKSDPEALRPGVRHPGDRLVIQILQVSEDPLFILRHIGAVPVQTPHIPGKVPLSDDALRDAAAHKVPLHAYQSLIPGIILQKLTDLLTDVFRRRHCIRPGPVPGPVSANHLVISR